MRPIIYVEVKLKDDASTDSAINTDEIAKEVENRLRSEVASLKVGAQLDKSSLQVNNAIQSIAVVQHSHGLSNVYHSLSAHELDIAVYSLYHEDNDSAVSDCDEEQISQFSTILQLPHKSLEGKWESLIYDNGLPESLLRMITGMIEATNLRNLDPAKAPKRNLILLHGPPGTGKSTLAQVLAQKLAIRFAHSFPTAKLVDVKGHALFTSMFGGSAKLVGQLFNAIWSESLDTNALIFVVIDEVESIAGSREHATQAHEVADGMRATNEFLRGFDRLQNQSNVVFICTSNLLETLDPAFKNRCRVTEFICAPSVHCIYEILRDVINEMIRTKIITYDATDSESTASQEADHETDRTLPAPSSDSNPLVGSSTQQSRDVQFIPDATSMKPGLLLSTGSLTVPGKLWKSAELAAGLTGRTLRDLPWTALFRYTYDKPCAITDLLDALRRVIYEQKGIKNDEQEQLEDEAIPSSPARVDVGDGEDNANLHEFLRKKGIYEFWESMGMENPLKGL